MYVCAPSDIDDAFRYDLAHVSSSLFLEDGNLRPVKKADLGNLLKQSSVLGSYPGKILTVFDGGLLFLPRFGKNELPAAKY